MKVNKGGVLMITNESIVAEIVTDIPLSADIFQKIWHRLLLWWQYIYK